MAPCASTHNAPKKPLFALTLVGGSRHRANPLSPPFPSAHHGAKKNDNTNQIRCTGERERILARAQQLTEPDGDDEPWMANEGWERCIVGLEDDGENLGE